MFEVYDVIVVGGGHAGCEAAHAAASMGSRVLLISMNLQHLGAMSCNPAMGGIAKGQIVREIDALGGLSGIVTDNSTIQFRMLNRSKGPGMWSPRAQCDRSLFSSSWRQYLEANNNVFFWQDTVREIIVSRGTVEGVFTASGQKIFGKSVVLTTGTFLNGTIHIGRNNQSGGRIGEQSARGLTEQLCSLGFHSERLKTGTPPRVDGRSIDYSKMEEQQGDDQVSGFSFLPIEKIKSTQQRCCWITYTNRNVHEILKSGFDESPMFQGDIQGTGPRYCPSIEDKINRFADKLQHQLFVEPEGWNTVEVYVNGFSTSLPARVQFDALRQVNGFENCVLFRPGYAIEYDYFPPTQLNNTLRTKAIDNLFFAGQINGTTGYEEAACQGLIAGINAHNLIHNKEPFVLRRNEAYIGVLIDDLISKGTDEPYRMFTSRAEYRTLLRQDNADLRLTRRSAQIGLASSERLEILDRKEIALQEIKSTLSQHKLSPELVNSYLFQKASTPISERTSFQKLLLRPGIHLEELIAHLPEEMNAFQDLDSEIIEQAEIQIKYEVYIQKEHSMALRMNQLEDLGLPSSLDYNSISSISIEARQKLSTVRPATLGQASRISGVNPSDIQILMLLLGR
ncbi:MAG: tRNA uridine-5-carboxymethylaminomethyl(34) synthesis enzyme MnmG [Bacteroidetes bacterium]|nr:tRNA uridine-5-carboxymethylaminomethyl(34) synthesis enzyme MnmG [Bacteroidota bacterium]